MMIVLLVSLVLSQALLGDKRAKAILDVVDIPVCTNSLQFRLH